jgi:hypothetical protein
MSNATRVTVSTMGVIAALAGLEHGIGELLQGNVAPTGLVIKSWPDSAFFDIWAGEPAMTVVPNLRVSGLLTIFVALIFIVWVTLFIQRKHGGLVLMLLSAVWLLVGGGFGPPLLGLILGAVATRIHAPATRGNARGFRLVLGQMWGWSLAACVIAWLMLFPGAGILTTSFGVNDPNLASALIFIAFGLLLLTILLAFARDGQRPANSPLSAAR